MLEDDKTPVVKNTADVSPEKQADILQQTFKHYFEMAMDHHTKAATTSNILLIIVAAIIGLISHDNNISGPADFVGGLAVFVIGLFGMVWVWKQHERYYYWSHIAYQYQKELIKMMSRLKTLETYCHDVQDSAAKKFGSLFAKHIDRYLWVSLHFIVVVIGLVLMAKAA